MGHEIYSVGQEAFLSEISQNKTIGQNRIRLPAHGQRRAALYNFHLFRTVSWISGMECWLQVTLLKSEKAAVLECRVQREHSGPHPHPRGGVGTRRGSAEQKTRSWGAQEAPPTTSRARLSPENHTGFYVAMLISVSDQTLQVKPFFSLEPELTCGYLRK